jgi:hypothetical protein
VSFNSEAPPLQLDQLLDACPNLSELCMESNTEIQSAAELRPDTLGHLRILRSKKINMQPGLMLQILQMAPKLSALDFGSDMLDLADLEMLAELVEQGVCLRHLERLEVTLVPRDNNVSEQWQRQLDLLIITCSTHCKQLHEVDVKDFLLVLMKLLNL